MEIRGVDELCGLVLGGGDEVCAIWGPLEIGYLHVDFMYLNIVELFSGLYVISLTIPAQYP